MNFNQRHSAGSRISRPSQVARRQPAGRSDEGPRRRRRDQGSRRAQKIPQRPRRPGRRREAEGLGPCLSWPKEYGGRGATHDPARHLGSGRSKYGALSAPFAIQPGHVRPVIGLRHRRPEAPPAAARQRRGSLGCQLSETGGRLSDLAGLRTRRKRTATTGSSTARRSGPPARISATTASSSRAPTRRSPSTKGLTMFFLDMKSPGVEVRRSSRQAAIPASTRVYFTNVKIPDAQHLQGQRRLERLADDADERAFLDRRAPCDRRAGIPRVRVAVAHGRQDADARRPRGALALSNMGGARSNGLKYTAYRAISALSRGERRDRRIPSASWSRRPMTRDIAMYALDLQGPMGAVSRDDKCAGRQTLPDAVPCRWHAHRQRHRRGDAQHHRRSACWACPATSASTKDVPFNQIPTKGR